MKSLPADFDQTASVSYFNATEIRDRLAGSAEKGMFGGLKGSAGTWDKIVKAYEKQSKQAFIPTITILAHVPHILHDLCSWKTCSLKC